VRIRQIRSADGEAIEPLRIGEPDQWINVRQERSLPHGMAMMCPVTASIDGRGWSVLDADGFRVPLDGEEHVEVIAHEPAGSSLAVDGEDHAGSLSLVWRSDAGPEAFDVVNHVPMERYLPGVLARELYNHWHFETHAAQAVAARSFAAAECAFFARRRHFDVTNTQQSQVYGGLTTHRTSLDAVAATIGLVLAWDGKLVPGYYSSCCGGRAASAVDAIAANVINDVPPLHGQSEEDVCVELPIARWTSQQPLAALTRRLVVFGEAHRHAEMAGLITIESIEPSALNAHGRPTRYVVLDQRGHTADVAAETLRRAANFAERGLHPPQRLLRSGDFTFERRGDQAIFNGRGFGHGAGMCQHGAELLARRGFHYRDILARYYPGAAAVRAYM
jgi:stage II sporulation protein D